MKFLFQVDQREAVLRGINAPKSSKRVEIDPEQMTEGQRDVLGQLADENLDARNKRVWRERRTEKFGNIKVSAGPVALVEQTAEEAHRKIVELDMLLDREIEQTIEYCEEEARRRKAEFAENLQSYGEDRPEMPKEFYFDREGVWLNPEIADSESSELDFFFDDETQKQRYVSKIWKVPRNVPDCKEVGGDDELMKRWQELVDWRKERIEQIVRNNQQEVMAEIAEKKRAEEQAAREWEAYYARLPEGVRERHQEGFVDEKREIVRPIERMIVKDLMGEAWTLYEDFKEDTLGGRWHEKDSCTLSDEQYRKFKQLRETDTEQKVELRVWTRQHQTSVGGVQKLPGERVIAGMRTAEKAGRRVVGICRIDLE